MGGGDLNLKKSWHPSTLRNIERVWKAEQKHEAEKQKIEQLQKELAAERAREEIQLYAEDQGVVKKKDEKLDWMYQGPAAMVNREEYLMGRKIDKTFETLQQVEKGAPPKDEGNDVGSSMFSSQNLSGTATVDLANKIREDPLFNIMKKEKEQKKNLLCNPVKMKQLQQMLQASLKHKSKKTKKSKKKQQYDSDDEVVPKKKKHKKHRSSDSEPESLSKDSRNLFKSKYQDKSSDYKASKYDEDEEDRRYSSSSSYNRREESHRSRNNPHHKQTYHEESEKRSKNHSEYSTFQENHHRDSDRYRQNYDSQKRRDNYKNDSKDSYQRELSDSVPKKKLDEKERERLLKEMQENAKWREDQRKKNATRYKEEEEREDKVRRIDSSDFMKPMLAKAAGKGSVESRVKQKIFTIQRSSAAMDKNFARRD